MTTPKHEVKYIPIDQFVPNPWNPQKMDEAMFNRLVDEMKENGCIAPLQAVVHEDGKYRIIGGEHRWKAGQIAGLDELPALVMTGKRWSDEDLQKFVTVRLNIIGGETDPERFLKLYNEMAEKFGKEAMQTMFGYTDTRAFQKLIGTMKRGLKQSLPKEAQKEFDEKAREAKTVEDLSAIVQMLFQKYGDTIPKGYMVFTYGTQQHIYVQMDPKMKRALDKVLNYCAETNTNLNTFFAPVIDTAVKKAAAALAEKEPKAQAG
jgi:hypothetical protein